MLKISFDYDSTLENKSLQRIAKDLVDSGYDVCIVTTRYSDTSKYAFECTNTEVFEAAHFCGIEEIHFTEFEWKYTCIDQWKVDIHIDDCYEDEVKAINNNCKCVALLYEPLDETFEDKLYHKIGEIQCQN